MNLTTVTRDAYTIANTIRQQIGLDVWLAVSARTPRYWTTDNGDIALAFRFGSRYGLPHWCEITYRFGSDSYDINAYKIHRNGVKRTLSIPSEIDGTDWANWTDVYADMLRVFVREANLMAEYGN